VIDLRTTPLFPSRPASRLEKNSYTARNPLTGLFWCNEDQDDQDVWETLVVTRKDSEDNTIAKVRDLEDFARIWMQITPALENVTAELSWRNTTGSPAVKIYKAFELDGGDRYLKEQAYGEGQMSGSYGTVLGTVASGGSYSFDQNYFSDGEVKHFVFEGASQGSGELVLQIKKDGQVIAESSVHLDLKDVKEMYEQASVSDDANFDTPVPENAQFNWVLNRTLPADSDEEKRLIVYVHGFNTGLEDHFVQAETLFKRLYWQGYKGRYASFRWPSPLLFLNEGEIVAYNLGEFKAWKSGLAFKGYLDYLATTPRLQGYTINVAAHSMGNIVTGSALKNGATIDNYVLMQAAVPAGCYDLRHEINNFERFLTAEGSRPTPDYAEDLGYRDYLPVGGQVRGSIVNFFNEVDFALTTAWENNEAILKPYDEVGDGRYDYGDPDPAPPEEPQPYHVDIFGFDYFVTDAHESMAFVARPRSKAAGALGATAGTIEDRVNVGEGTVHNFGRATEEHSAEFTRSIQGLQPFYSELLRVTK
jgi:hypothetical protein